MSESIHQFTTNDLSGKDFDLESLKGKKAMIVNTASKCGLTPQYKQLQAMYETYKPEGFIIIGFPANNFMAQEPGSDTEIADFCEANYGVTFPMMSKINVVGEEMDPIYKFLTQKEKNGVMDSKVTWNFQKYLLNEEGILEKVIDPRTSPDDSEVIDWITSK
jgi:glutathione peroxidase